MRRDGLNSMVWGKSIGGYEQVAIGGRVLVVSVEGPVMIIHGQDHGISSY